VSLKGKINDILPLAPAGGVFLDVLGWIDYGDGGSVSEVVEASPDVKVLILGRG